MKEAKHASISLNKESAAMKKGNLAAYNPKGDSDTDTRSHGSRPSHINRPELKGTNA